MPYQRRGEGPDFLERWGNVILFAILIACLIGIIELARLFI